MATPTCPSPAANIKAKAKNAQEAHEAIRRPIWSRRPTEMRRRLDAEQPSSLS